MVTRNPITRCMIEYVTEDASESEVGNILYKGHQIEHAQKFTGSAGLFMIIYYPNCFSLHQKDLIAFSNKTKESAYFFSSFPVSNHNFCATLLSLNSWFNLSWLVSYPLLHWEKTKQTNAEFFFKLNVKIQF